MEWQGQGMVIASRPHGEHAVILDVLTPERGRYAGLLRGGQSRRMAPLLQPGNILSLAWRARLEDQLGTFTAELQRDRAGRLMADRRMLAGLAAVSGLLAHALPERLHLPGIYERSSELLDLMPLTPAWTLAYLRWELALLEALGYGLELDRCAVRGTNEDLCFVSPRTGRAVSRQAAGEWADRLLPLPDCLKGQGPAPDEEIALALVTTGHFLQRHVPPQRSGQAIPASRARLVELLRRGMPGRAAPA
ncbi:DNA repair protein RecO [Mangrovicoccus algicola]|uniref:DNA repair protein RecO n=1 Tax=Mangrovicoccus algicola TaxID=2771008 RepID=A0A8J7CIL3_9RHOB|nr:DNA repair protein RecO [Mangrovicoccus algicola]MBE3639705.1 DNA repair protein RecO [Mangrovicoccus algicola]